MTATIKNITKEEDKKYIEAFAPPDGGWGWVVVFGSFMLHLVFDGLNYSFGIFYDEFLTYFQEGKSKTSWILSILVGVSYCSGPIVSLLVNKYGGRLVTIIGAILSSIFLGISYYAENVVTLYFTIGLGVGFGIGLMYLPAIVCVTTWFEKKRSLATGIAVCGSGVGTFLFAPLVTKILQLYGWRVSMLIVAGIVMCCVIFGALFRPIKVEEMPNFIRKPTLASIPELPEITENGTQENATEDNEFHNGTKHNLHHIFRPRSTSLSPSPKKHFPHHTNGTSYDLHGHKHVVINRAKSSSLGDIYEKYKASLEHEHKGPTHGPLDKPDVFYTGEMMNIPDYRRMSVLDRDLGKSAFAYKNRHNDESKGCCSSSKSINLLLEMLDLRLFKDIPYVIFLISNFLTCLGFNIPYVYLVPSAKADGISSEEAGYLISVIGIANTVGRIILGYVCDMPRVNRKQVYIWCLIVAGAGTVLGAFLDKFYTLAIYSSVYGCTIGAYVGLSSVILVDLIGLEKLTNAFGHVLLFSGAGSIIGSPIAGWLYDISGKYEMAFYFGGCSIALSGIILFLIYPLQKSKNKKCEIENEV